MSVICFLLWLVLNGRITWEIVLFGIGIDAVLMAFLWKILGWSAEKESLFLRSLPIFLEYLGNLLWETVKAALSVLGVALNPSLHPEPVLVEFRSGLNREYQNVILANSITLTPGTITVFQEHDRFVVHALRREYAQGLSDSSFVRILKRFP